MIVSLNNRLATIPLAIFLGLCSALVIIHPSHCEISADSGTGRRSKAAAGERRGLEFEPANPLEALQAPPEARRSPWTVTDEWPEEVPITEAEIEVFERYVGDVFDELFGPIDPINRPKP